MALTWLYLSDRRSRKSPWLDFLTKEGYTVIRCDDPAEVESILVRHADIVEAAAIGVPHDVKGSELILFAVTRQGVERSDVLRQQLHEMVVSEMGKPLAPKSILFVSDLPKTRNAKVMRRMIRAAYLGLELGDTSSLVNPQAVEEIKGLR